LPAQSVPRAVCCLLACLAIAAPAAAQQRNEPIGRFALDVRGVFARHKIEPSIATELAVAAGNLPTRSFGLVGGAHYYPWRTSKITLGIGGEMLLARGSRTIDMLGADGKTTTPGPTVRRHFTSVAPEISLNFGHRNGWSYISGGMFGSSKLYLERADARANGVPRRRTLNYGGGARWFTNDHIAFSVDFRWYSVAEQPASPTGAVLEPRTTLLVLSGGIGIR
jgi:hypothetical protein